MTELVKISIYEDCQKALDRIHSHLSSDHSLYFENYFRGEFLLIKFDLETRNI